MLAYHGDLGLDSGVPQSVYTLDKKQLDPIHKPDGKPLRVDLALGRTVQLPDGLGSVTFDGVSRFVKLQVSRTPATGWHCWASCLALLGLLGLAVHPARDGSGSGSAADRRGPRTLVEVAGLDRSAGGDLAGEIDDR